MIIPVDHGNKQIKTLHHTFTSGLSKSETSIPFGSDVLTHRRKFYTISEERIPYMRDKTEDDRFYILTLFAIAYELMAAGKVPGDGTIDVQLPVGLPPAHFGMQYKQFESYFKRDHVEQVELRQQIFNIYITDVVAYPQAYTAIMPIFSRINSLSKTIIVDIGGFTADYLLLRNGQADLNVCDSLENGVITLYNKIIAQVNSAYDILLVEADIDAILKEDEHGFAHNIVQIVVESSQTFISDLISKLRERMIDLRSGQTVLVGGGAMLLRKQIERSGKVRSPIFVEEITANAKGYEMLYFASQAGR